MTFGQIVVLAWLFGKFAPKEKAPPKEQKNSIWDSEVDFEAAGRLNWGLWFFFAFVAVAVVVCLFIAKHPFLAGGFGGIAALALSVPLKTIVKDRQE